LPRILLFDIETAPSLGWVWEKYETTVLDFKKDWYILSFAWKWLGDRKVQVRALPDYPQYNTDPENDAALVAELWKLLDECDVAVAHNVRFDTRKSNSRFLIHGMAPPSPYKTVDTLAIARQQFGFTSNRLDDLGQALGVGRKAKHQGKHTWLGCMRGDRKAWATMAKYNAVDVDLLEAVFLKLRPWAKNHALEVYTRGQACPSCQSPKLTHRGFNLTKTGRRQRFQCQGCGAWSSGLHHEKETLSKTK
jgi:hypothetical protein